MNTTYDLIDFLKRQTTFSEATFGPGAAGERILEHLKEEIKEIEADPTDPFEWIDVILLAFDNLLRLGYSPYQIIELLDRKMHVNETRRWPDWRTVNLNRPINHIRSGNEIQTNK